MFGITDYTKPIVDFANFEASSILDALAFGGAMLLIGMATVFSVLCLLWACLAIFKLVFHDLPAKKAAKPESVVEAVPVQETVQVTSDTEIVAVIAAAIAMAEAESFGTKFNVVSFKRK